MGEHIGPQRFSIMEGIVNDVTNLILDWDLIYSVNTLFSFNDSYQDHLFLYHYIDLIISESIMPSDGFIYYNVHFSGTCRDKFEI
jgi:hypothetical protein